MPYLGHHGFIASFCQKLRRRAHGRAARLKEPLGRFGKRHPDLWRDDHMAYGVPGFEGTRSVHIGQRKNDAERKGHYPAVGRARDPSLDIVSQLRVWMRTAGLVVHPTCQKLRPAAICTVCPLLFPLSQMGGRRAHDRHGASLHSPASQRVDPAGSG